jgi:plastocyanin
MRRILIALTLLAAAGALAAGCGGNTSGSGGYGSGGASPATTAAPSGAVAIDDFAFSPATLKVKVGQKVTWTNKQGVAHTVTADGGTFDHPMPSGATFSFAFVKAGSFAYHRTIHPSIHATIVVS